MNSSRHYIFVFAALAIIVPGFVAATNLAIDPYGFFRTPLTAGLNVVKPEMGFHEKTLKAHRVTTLQPAGLVLGTSASDVGLSPDHPGWSVAPVYNLAVGNASINLIHRYLQHAISFQKPEQIVLGLELAAFNPAQQVIPGTDPAAFAVDQNGNRNRDYLALNYYAKALSLDMFRSSLTTFSANRKRPLNAAEYNPHISATGVMNPESFPVNSWQTYRTRFQDIVAKHIERFWAPIDEFRTLESFAGDPTFALLPRVIRLACNNNIELHIVLSPFHAYLLEAQRAAGLTPAWEAWQRAVVSAANDEAVSAGCNPVPVWDFSGYNPVTTISIARSKDPADAPPQFWDPVHYKTAVGDAMLSQVFGLEDEARIPDFGVRLTPENIDRHIEATRQRGAEYRARTSEEVALVEETVAKALRTGSK